ncbi:hypothetical protein ACQP1P_13120 [Dactylosporangium sp. CA-052675]|uniref:hypothetical protein n=1 Tax=Dactylosporangium sp. CA-052675 TaxID=3239927 RepID=UPI003D8E8FBD
MVGPRMPVHVPRPSRRISAEDILNGRYTMDGYPLRYCYLVPGSTARAGAAFSFGTGPADMMRDQVLSAVELLETRGWHLVASEQHGLVAYLRK